MKLKIEIVMDNAAFEPNSGTEAGRILRNVAKAIDGLTLKPRMNVHGMFLSDANGNIVGKAKVTR
jgi:hypothetical protein